MAKRINSGKEIRAGDFYEDCAFHPCLCVSVGAEENHPDAIEGISLVNGNLKGCNARHCGLRILTFDEAVQWKLHGPPDQKVESNQQWWKNA